MDVWRRCGCQRLACLHPPQSRNASWAGPSAPSALLRPAMPCCAGQLSRAWLGLATAHAAPLGNSGHNPAMPPASSCSCLAPPCPCACTGASRGMPLTHSQGPPSPHRPATHLVLVPLQLLHRLRNGKVPHHDGCVARPRHHRPSRAAVQHAWGRVRQCRHKVRVPHLKEGNGGKAVGMRSHTNAVTHQAASLPCRTGALCAPIARGNTPSSCLPRPAPPCSPPVPPCNLPPPPLPPLPSAPFPGPSPACWSRCSCHLPLRPTA